MSTLSTGAADRGEAIERPEESRASVVVPGVELRPMVGAHNGARGLFTGLLSLAPGASYPFYTRTVCEALVVLEGEAAIDVEDRRYRLGPFDAATVMPQQPRRLVNLSADRPAVFHVAMASESAEQSWINGRFVAGRAAVRRDGPGGVRAGLPTRRCAVVRAGTPRAVPGPLQRPARFARASAAATDSSNPARLPCHRHEFDESITIVQGTATCVVEGRRHELSGCATAMVPQGRCHYFINLTLEPMAMIWVYAGDMPDRIVVDESLCLRSGQS